MKLNSDVAAIVTHCQTCGAEVELSPNAAAYSARGILCKACMRQPKQKRMTPELYAEYLQSNHWESMRHLALDRAGHRCKVCASTARLEVHHNNYDNLGGEPLVDLVVLCSLCHSLFHGVA